MRVLFCRHNSICEIGIIRAFDNNGIEVLTLEHDVSKIENDPDFYANLIEKIELLKPDFVFSVNFIAVISDICSRYENLKYLCWIVDSPVLSLYNTRAINNQNNFIFIFDSIQYAEFKQKCTSAHMFYFPLGCDIEAYDKIVLSDDDLARYNHDVTFIGSLYTEKSPYNNIEKRLPEYLQGYIRAIVEAQSRICGFNFLHESLNNEVTCQLERCLSLYQGDEYEIDSKTLISNIFLNPKCTEMERIRLLNLIAGFFRVDFYTTSDVKPLNNVNCHGPAGTYGAMPKIFKNSKINLNITAKGIQAGGSLRVYDVLGCGGMLITNYQKDLAEQFTDGEELVFYYSDEDLIGKIDYYLNNEDERRRIAANGYNKVKAKYTYTVRIEEMLKKAEVIKES